MRAFSLVCFAALQEMNGRGVECEEQLVEEVTKPKPGGGGPSKAGAGAAGAGATTAAAGGPKGAGAGARRQSVHGVILTDAELRELEPQFNLLAVEDADYQLE